MHRIFHKAVQKMRVKSAESIWTNHTSWTLQPSKTDGTTFILREMVCDREHKTWTENDNNENVEMDLTHSRLWSYCTSPDFLPLPACPSAIVLLCMNVCERSEFGNGAKGQWRPSWAQPLLGPQSPNTSQTSFDLDSDVRFERRPRKQLWAVEAELKREESSLAVSPAGQKGFGGDVTQRWGRPTICAMQRLSDISDRVCSRCPT